MPEQQRTLPTAEVLDRPRDPQNFTRGDVIAWKVVAYLGIGVTAVGSTAAIIAAVAFATA